MDIDELRKRAATEPNPALRDVYTEDLEKATAKLVRGKDLTPAQREAVRNQFVNRLTPENRHRAFGSYVHEDRDPESGDVEHATHSYPQSGESENDDAWIDSHAFYIRRDGTIASRPGYAEPEYLARDDKAAAAGQPKRYPTIKKPGDPTYSAEWSGVTGAPVAQGKTCPDCGGKLHREAGSFYCPHCDDYKTPKEGYKAAGAGGRLRKDGEGPVIIKQHGEEKARVADVNAAFEWLLKHTNHSVAYAQVYDGYTVEDEDGKQLMEKPHYSVPSSRSRRSGARSR